MILDRIDSPEDLKKVPMAQLPALCDEIRGILMKKLSEHGGHIAPNLGVVELTVALHYVFDSPEDKIVYDVSHQSYVHKMLTGRKQAFIDAQRYDDVSGYGNPAESAHDFFVVGHTSTSVSLACGLAKARDLKGTSENIVAVIGDGSLSGGEAYEGLNNAVENGTNMIVIVNDNEMSIAENRGGLYRNLQRLRETDGQCECNFFKAMGFDYRYVADGNDVGQVIETLRAVKDSRGPVLIHAHTVKGKGYAPAEADKERWHWGGPFDLATGQPKYTAAEEDYADLTARYLLDRMRRDPRLVAVTSATPAVFGFDAPRRAQAGKQFVDVGIAEEHAVALISGIAANGGTPVYGVYATFLSRAYDQLSQDLCINGNPATVLVFGASVYGMNDVTHLGIYDVAMLSNIPDLVYLAPTCKEEYLAMLRWATTQRKRPVAIRVPAAGVIVRCKEDTTDYDRINRFEVVKEGSAAAVIAVGDLFPLGERTVRALALRGIDATLINPKFVSGLDTELLDRLKANHRVVITLESGTIEGGFGEKIARYYGASDVKVKAYGVAKSFPDRFDPEELLRQNGLDAQAIAEEVAALLN